MLDRLESMSAPLQKASEGLFHAVSEILKNQGASGGSGGSTGSGAGETGGGVGDAFNPKMVQDVLDGMKNIFT